MAMRQRAGHGEGVAIRGEHDAAFEYAAQALNVGGGPKGPELPGAIDLEN